MSDTPLTDAKAHEAMRQFSGHPTGVTEAFEAVDSSFARDLERKLNELKLTLESHGPEGHNAINSQVFSIRKERDEALAQMCELCGRLSNIAEDAEAWLNSENDLPSVEIVKAIRDYAREAIK
jgi:hypothetical protein